MATKPEQTADEKLLEQVTVDETLVDTFDWVQRYIPVEL